MERLGTHRIQCYCPVLARGLGCVGEYASRLDRLAGQYSVPYESRFDIGELWSARRPRRQFCFQHLLGDCTMVAR